LALKRKVLKYYILRASIFHVTFEIATNRSIFHNLSVKKIRFIIVFTKGGLIKWHIDPHALLSIVNELSAGMDLHRKTVATAAVERVDGKRTES